MNTTFEQQMDELAEMIKSGKECVYVRSRQDGRVKAALKARGIDTPEYKKPESTPKRWLPEIEDETLPAGYWHWTNEERAEYQKWLKKIMEHIVPKNLPKVGSVYLTSMSGDEGSQDFKRLFLSAENNSEEK